MTMKPLVMCLSMIIVLCVSAHTASAAPSISVEPASIKVSQGENFTVSILVDPAGSEIMSAQYTLYFDSALLNVVDQRKGTFLGHDGASTVNIANKIDGMPIEYGEMRTGVADGVTTSGILATITFNATGHGECDLTLDDVILSDPDAQEIPDVVVNDGTCDIGAAEQTPTHTPTATATTISTITATPTQTPTSAPTTPVTTATVVQTNVISPTPPLPEPQITATPSTTPTPPLMHPSKDNTPQSGFALAFATIGLLVASYTILKRKR